MEKIYTAKQLEEAKGLAYEELDPVTVDVKSVFAGSSEAVKAVNKEEDISYEASKEENEAEEAYDENDPALTCAKIQRATAYLTNVLKALGLEKFEINPVKKGDMVILDIGGEDGFLCHSPVPYHFGGQQRGRELLPLKHRLLRLPRQEEGNPGGSCRKDRKKGIEAGQTCGLGAYEPL